MKTHTNKNMFIIFAIILLEGLISISVEVLAIRQITPFVGSNIINTSFVIGSFLLFLALGYRKGGQVNNNHFKKLSKNLLISQLFIVIGLSYLFLDILYHITLDSYIFTMFFSLFIVGTIVYFLGQTVPILSNFFTEQSIAKISGTILFLSTFGSFLGSIGTATISINFLGVNNTIIILTFIIFIVNLLIYTYNKEKIYLLLSSLLVILSLFMDSKLFITDNSYSNISVMENIKMNKIGFIVNRSASSGLDINRTESYFWYIQQLEKYINLNTKNSEKGENILVAGAGGFTLGLDDTKNHYTFVDIDKGLQEVSEKYFLKKKINGIFVVSSIRNYLKYTKKKFRYIILDTYSNSVTIPPFHTTKEYMQEISNVLTTDGEALFNIIYKSDFSTIYSRTIHQTINSVFNCAITPNKYHSNKKTNVLYFCQPKQEDTIYTDNLINLFNLPRE